MITTTQTLSSSKPVRSCDFLTNPQWVPSKDYVTRPPKLQTRLAQFAHRVFRFLFRSVAGPGGGGGQYEHHLSRSILTSAGLVVAASPDGPGGGGGHDGGLTGHHGGHYPLHHQMSYHNMFTPSREPGTAWRCRSCGKEVTNRWHHFHSHTPQRSVCPYCPASYSRIDTLRSHLRIKHADRLNAPKFGTPTNCKMQM